MKTKVVHVREAYDVYIGRGSVWGNPFVIGKHGDRDEVCDKYVSWFMAQPDLIKRGGELRGKRLGCYCKPKRCHGDFLVNLIEGGVR